MGKSILFAIVLGCMGLVSVLLKASVAEAQATPPIVVDVQLGSLRDVPTPTPPRLTEFVRDVRSARALGKALFWDQQVGSDQQACASCHFAAGADNRTVNQLNPAFRSIGEAVSFTPPFGPNYRLRASDFPLHRLSDPNNHLSTFLFDTNNVVSSQGVSPGNFGGINFGSAGLNAFDNGTTPASSFFGVNGTNVRGVEPRNTPTVINAIFNFRNFWDGRARNEFNGVTPIGDLDPTARVLLATTPNAGDIRPVQIRITSASLASQAVGPPLANLEMSYAGRTFPILGKKMLSVTPLAQQVVAPDDSVLGRLSRSPSTGLKCGGSFVDTCGAPGGQINYEQMIRDAFEPIWFQSTQIVTVNGTNPDGTLNLGFSSSGDLSPDSNQFTQMQFNFSLFFGLAIQLYEATLRSDQTPFDHFMNGDVDALTPDQQAGLQIFQGQGRCIACHSGAEFTNASVRNVENEKLERMIMGNDRVAVYDNGFYNTAVTRCAGQAGPCDDVGIGATIGPLNLPLSLSRFFQMPENIAAAPPIQPRPLEGIGPEPLVSNERVAVDGAFKTPGLRNVELTAPYFHNGGELTLMDVVNFYNRGGNFPEFNRDNFDPNIVNLGLTDAQKHQLVQFLLALTDPRVKFEQAPFDHPSLTVPAGAACANPSSASGACNGLDPGAVRTINGVTVAETRITIPPVGRHGHVGRPISTFAQNLAP